MKKKQKKYKKKSPIDLGDPLMDLIESCRDLTAGVIRRVQTGDDVIEFYEAQIRGRVVLLSHAKRLIYMLNVQKRTYNRWLSEELVKRGMEGHEKYSTMEYEYESAIPEPIGYKRKKDK